MSKLVKNTGAGIEALKQARLNQGSGYEHKDPIQKAKLKPKSLRLAINAKCYDCSCGCKKEVKICIVTGCPLYPVRPYQDKNVEELDSDNSDEPEEFDGTDQVEED